MKSSSSSSDQFVTSRVETTVDDDDDVDHSYLDWLNIFAHFCLVSDRAEQKEFHFMEFFIIWVAAAAAADLIEKFSCVISSVCHKTFSTSISRSFFSPLAVDRSFKRSWFTLSSRKAFHFISFQSRVQLALTCLWLWWSTVIGMWNWKEIKSRSTVRKGSFEEKLKRLKNSLQEVCCFWLRRKSVKFIESTSNDVTTVKFAHNCYLVCAKRLFILSVKE